MQSVTFIDNTSASHLYDSLPSETFRLLIIQPAVDLQAPLRCSLKVAKPANSTYTALSYCWGDVNNVVPIYVDDAVKWITTNLHAGLRELRKADLKLTLWVDAICINQHDLAERANQVEMMHDIYSNANTVVVWLGPEENESYRAMRFIVYWGQKCALKNVFGVERDRQQFAHELLSVHLCSPWTWTAVNRIDNNANWTALFYFLRRQWWRRVWILQEFVLGGNVDIVCGNERIGWNMLECLWIIPLGRLQSGNPEVTSKLRSTISTWIEGLGNEVLYVVSDLIHHRYRWQETTAHGHDPRHQHPLYVAMCLGRRLCSGPP